MASNPQFPIYIPSKGRFDTRLTMKALDGMNVPYFVIVEGSEYDDYAAVIDHKKILVMDPKWQKEYVTLDTLGDTRIYGGGPPRNMAWEHAIENGFAWHWVIDDNIRYFQRLNRNRKIPMGDGTGFRVMEDFVLRYKNVGMAGPQYAMFAPRKKKWPPFVLNTRIYSCNLIRNDLPFRWRGRMNEDTDLSLKVLKAGYCTIQFNVFLQNKTVTQQVKGGNTEQYLKDGTHTKSQWLVNLHPDVARMTFRYGRVHHIINYHIFKQKLIRDPKVKVGKGINDYGMTVKTVEASQ